MPCMEHPRASNETARADSKNETSRKRKTKRRKKKEPRKRTPKVKQELTQIGTASFWD